MIRITGIEDLPDELLPGLLMDVKQLIGPECAWKLLQHYGGVHVRIPKCLSAEHPLVQTLGLRDAQRLCEIYGGEVITVPKAQAALRGWRDRIIVTERDAGADIRTLALAWRLTERRVYEILSESRSRDVRQIDLFETI
jgi:hypothetical protein